MSVVDLTLMSWKLCEKCFLKRVEKDDWRVDTIIKMAKLRLEKIKMYRAIDEVSFIVEDYYEVIKELLVAYMLRGGLRARNHQCLISYFAMKNSGYEREAHTILQMSYFRNRLDYYGESVPVKFYEMNKGEFKRIVGLILGLLEVGEK